jgi:hypothetical protein
MVGPNSPRCAPGAALTFADAVVLLITFAVAFGDRESKKKPTTVASRGFLSKFNLTSTRRHGVAYDDNDRQHYLSNSINHCGQNKQESTRRSSAD